MENKMNDMENIVELIDENNELVSFRYLMTLDYDNREYIVLAPLDEGTEEDEVVILRVEQNEEGDDYCIAIEDRKELNDVLLAVNEVYEQTLN